MSFVKDGVATYKLPEMIEVFSELPFTPTGKIQRHVLVRQVLERAGFRDAGVNDHDGASRPSN